MIFPGKLIPGKLIKRYKRFLADVELEDGSRVTAHCTNSGSMKTCLEDRAPVYLSPVENPTRKTRFTWEMIYMNNGIEIIPLIAKVSPIQIELGHEIDLELIK